MFWQKKSEKRLPDLPPLKIPPAGSLQFLQEPTVDAESEDDLEMLSSEKQELPSFPDSINDKGFSQAAIKDAVIESEKTEAGDGAVSKKDEKNFKAIEMEEWTPSIAENTKPDFITNVHSAVPPSINLSPRIKPKFEEPPKLEMDRPMIRPWRTEKNADVFVKLDKFYSARKALADVQQKLDEADELLKKIRETKMREEQELVAWEKELMTVKGRVNDINQNLFEKVD